MYEYICFSANSRRGCGVRAYAYFVVMPQKYCFKKVRPDDGLCPRLSSIIILPFLNITNSFLVCGYGF